MKNVQIMLKLFVLFLLTSIAESKCEELNDNTTKFVVNRIDLQPLVHFEPVYPNEALQRNERGYCKVSFDIAGNTLRRPINIKVIECFPENVFETSCIDSVSKWLFKADSNSQEEESPIGLISTCRFNTSPD